VKLHNFVRILKAYIPLAWVEAQLLKSLEKLNEKLVEVKGDPLYEGFRHLHSLQISVCFQYRKQPSNSDKEHKHL